MDDFIQIDDFNLDNTLNILLPGSVHLVSTHYQCLLDLTQTIPMGFLALLDMFQLIFHHKHMHFQLYW